MAPDASDPAAPMSAWPRPLVALLGLAAACSGTARTAPTFPASLAAPRPGYQLVWHDEFDTAALDTAKWTAYAGPRRDALNAPGAVAVADGVLTITTFTDGGVHSTGFIDTAGKFLATYGWFEARIRFETSPGEWGAFWITSPTIGPGDPAITGSEIDVVEHRARDASGADISNTYSINLHWNGYGAEHEHAGGEGAPPANAAPLQGGWHTYAVLWTPQGYTFFLDGVEQWATQAGTSRRPEFIKLTCEVANATWAGAIPNAGYGPRSKSTTRMQVDWVRVWQAAP